jgi:hypothetical protein
MLRSQGVSDQDAGLLTRIIFHFAKRRLGRIPLGVRIRALDPRFLKLAVRFDLYSASESAVPMHLKELAQLHVALMVGCAF